jgi:hypothetical protein
MDLSPARRPPLALLVDGENLPRDMARRILDEASRHGPPQVRRVYGNLNAISGWEEHGFRLCPTRPGKNAADMLLCVEAMMLALRDGFDTLAIASSDRDFSYLAEQLREVGKQVIGLVGQNAPRSFRNSCSLVAELNPATLPASSQTARLPVTKLVPIVRAVLANATAEGGWSTANWIKVGLRKQDAGFDLSSYSDRPLEATLIGLKTFQTMQTAKGTVLFRWPQAEAPSPAPHSAP